MIVDIDRFVEANRPHWERLDTMLRSIEDLGKELDLQQVRELHHLYERASSDLVRLETLAAAGGQAGVYLHSLVARAYTQVHQVRRRKLRWGLVGRWFARTLPDTFRRHIRAFALSTAILLAGGAFGAAAVALDTDAKDVLIPFGHLMIPPHERVQKEESSQAKGDERTVEHETVGAAWYMTNNTRVAIMTLALGALCGVGTMLMLFYNGVILGAVCIDYILDGQGVFLAGWLLPHGSVEIPAILLAGQAGLMLGRAILGYGNRFTLRQRLRQNYKDLVTLIAGVALLLVWAGIIEAFLSQHHQPVLPYWLKITFGLVQLMLLGAYLGRCGAGGAAGEQGKGT